MIFSFKFMQPDIPLGWSDVLWAYGRGLIGWRFPVDLANVRLDAGLLEHDLEIELAGFGKDDAWKVWDVVEQLAEYDQTPEQVSKSKLVFLAALWMYENWNELDDPFGKVEEIYADFDYPDEITPFVRYMPSVDDYDPRLYTKQENEKRLLGNWKEYLDNARSNFSK